MPRGAAFDNSPSATIPDLTGCVISNDRLHLRLATVVGRGGYGVVYKAEAVGASHESYAVKCINTSALREGERRSISREIQLQSACAKASKSVLCIEDVIVYDEEGYVFIITELCEGGDLLDHLLKGDFHGKDDLIRDSFVQIIDAVDACHRRGVYHRDLKPENIFCKKDGSLVLGDFGLATTSRNTRDFNTGSLPFMSPEVLGGLANERKPYSSPRADIWSLGVILLNLINAKLPWQKARAIDKVDKRGNIDACCDYFRTYLCNRRTYFHSEDFCISREVGEILGSVFAVDPRKRITLADLRTRVQNTRTFYRPELGAAAMFDMERYVSSDLDTDEFDSLSSTPSSPLDADADAAPPNPVKNTFRVRRNAFNYNSPQPRSISSPRMAKLQHHGAAPHQIPVDAATPARPEPDAADYEADAAAFSIGSSVFDSDTESEGPITPETRAADADADGANVVRLDDMAELNIGEAGPGLAEAAASVVAILVQNMGKGKAPAHVPGMGPVPDEPPASNIVWNVTDGAVA